MQPRLYSDLAAWWPLFSSPADYAEEAAWILAALESALGHIPATLLELGSGGGNVASHLPGSIALSLVDLNTGMVEVSRRLNPRADNIAGDMRTVRLSRTFEAVLIHDAVAYMTTLADLTAALCTARAHLDSGGIAIVLPDHIIERFEAGVSTGGHDANDASGRSVRYLEWTHAPAPGTSLHYVDYAILVREADGSVDVVHDRHEHGIFSRAQWRSAFASAGFDAPEAQVDPWGREVFIARADARRR